MSKPATYADISERVFTAHVIELARRLGWMAAHFRPAQSQRGRWITPVQGDGAGFPDLVLARGGEVIFAELKTAVGKPSDKQHAWLRTLPRAYVWRPKDIDEIERILKGGPLPMQS